jgi:hypothetical protein
MKHFLSVLALFAASVAFGQDLTIDGNVKTVKVEQIIVTSVDKLLVQSLPFTIKAPPGAFDYRWSFPATVSVLDMGDTLKVTAAPKGAVTVGVVIKTIDFDKKKVDSKFQELSFLVGEVPVPIPPVPDPPKPDPKPEPVNPAPIPVAGFRVMIVYESADKLSAAQTAIFTSRDIREYLDLRAIVGPDGKTKEWRIWDKDVSTANVSKLWQDAFAKVNASSGTYPKILISNGVTGFVGPLPSNVPDTLTLLKTYGGV